MELNDLFKKPKEQIKFSKSQKELLDLIIFLTKKNGYCFATNKYFIEKLNITEMTIQRNLSKFVSLGIIEITKENLGGKDGVKRKIFIKKDKVATLKNATLKNKKVSRNVSRKGTKNVSCLSLLNNNNIFLTFGEKENTKESNRKKTLVAKEIVEKLFQKNLLDERTDDKEKWVELCEDLLEEFIEASIEVGLKMSMEEKNGLDKITAFKNFMLENKAILNFEYEWLT